MTIALQRSRSWIAPEVVQTSSMDCGPAALKCLLEGFGIPVSYGRLREGCQTDIDGTSIDTIEAVSNSLGLQAEQVMIPADTVFGKTSVYPFMIAVRQADGPPHFLIVWNRLGSLLQVMDPSVGRRWISTSRLEQEIYIHETAVDAMDWRTWISEGDGKPALEEQLASCGIRGADASVLIGQASQDPTFRAFAALDASVRMVARLVSMKAIAKGSAEGQRIIKTMLDRVLEEGADATRILPEHFWSALPGASDAGQITIRGAVLLRFHGKSEAVDRTLEKDLSPELVAAIKEVAPNPLKAFWRLLKADGLLPPLVLAAALFVAAAGVLVEALLFRGLFDLASLFPQSGQRILAVVALFLFLLLLMAFRVPIMSEGLRFGRRLDVRLRMAFLNKIPRLNDRYFQSRPVSDMADRAHSLHILRGIPGLGIQAVQTLSDLLLTLVGLFLIDPTSAALSLLVIVSAICMPIFFRSVLSEAELRVRNHGISLSGIHLDTLLGQIPIRVHRAHAAVKRLHEANLVNWSRAVLHHSGVSLLASSAQQVFTVSISCAVIWNHFSRSHEVSGSDLLFIFWILKLPAIGSSLIGMAISYPSQRNVLLRLLEPMKAPEDNRSQTFEPSSIKPGPVEIQIQNGSVVAGGHSILTKIDLTIPAGQHVAIVGRSGAGKSTLLGIMLGWHRLSGGCVSVSGCNLGADELESLRERTAWVDPAVQIWNRSFLENLNSSSKSDSLEKVGKVIEQSDLRPVLQGLPDGIQQVLGEGGCLLSGGEGQRMRLGRAFMQSSADLVLLDEPFRGTDRRQRRKLLAEARSHWAQSTLLCVSHDIAETLYFDRVLVIDQGRIAEDGAPQQLLANRSLYHRLLNAERRAEANVWTSKTWRQLRMEGGHVHDVG